MAYPLASMTPSPAHVHPRAKELCGHAPGWRREPYRGGLWRRDHYRICSYCGSAHLGDMMALLRAGRSSIESAHKPGKLWFLTPNPIAGDLVRMGSLPGPIFSRDRSAPALSARLAAAARGDLQFTPTPAERLSGHFERPCLEIAPAMIEQPFFIDHTTEPQWALIEAALKIGAKHEASLPSARA